MESEFDSSEYERGADYMHILIVREGFTEEQAAEQASTMFKLTAAELLKYWYRD